MLLLPNYVESFDPDELSLLILTNEGSGPRPKNFENERVIILTTKSTYIWGIIVSRIVQLRPEISEEEVIQAFRSFLRRNKEFLQLYYSQDSIDPPYFPNERINLGGSGLIFDAIQEMSSTLNI